MIYKLHEEDRNIYAARIKINNSVLSWTSTNGIDVLIVKSPFQEYPENDLVTIIKYMNSNKYNSNSNTKDFERVEDTNYEIYYMRSTEYIHTQGKKVGIESASYTVFPCMSNGTEINIYSQSTSRVQHHVDYKISLEVSIYKKYNYEVKKANWFTKAQNIQIFSGFYKILFSDIFLELVNTSFFNEGDLYFNVNEFKIPINDEVIKQKEVYIRCNKRPDVKTIREDIELLNIYK